jgi:outer membrane lipopolysaccharide assembly protein LptE/RlpB
MKMKLSYILLIFLFTTIVFAGTFLEYFQGRSEDEDIRLEWKTREEVDLQNFRVERKTPQSSYVEIAIIEPKGSNSYYTYLDQSAYKSQNMMFIYRLKIVDNNGQVSYSNEVSVSHSVSGVKRTWGSIKAMFR